MPYKRRTPKKKRKTGYTDCHLKQLRSGFDFWGTAFGNNERRGGGGVRDMEGFKVAWEIFREQILADWIREEPKWLTSRACPHGGPGTRPYAWWVLDAPERRQRIDGKPHPFDTPERTAQWAKRPGPGREFDLFYGLPAVLSTQDDFAAIFETEAEYLDRLGLWLPGEQELLAEWRAREPEPRECEQWADDCPKLDGGEW